MGVHDAGRGLAAAQQHGLELLAATVGDLEGRTSDLRVGQKELLEWVMAVVILAMVGDVDGEVARDPLHVAHFKMVAVGSPVQPF